MAHEQSSSLQELVTIRATSERSSDTWEEALDTITTHGLVIVETGVTDVAAAKVELIDLRDYLGEPLGHKHADHDGHVLITADPSVYQDRVRRPQSDSGQQSPHTDGAFGEPPPIIALYALQPAARGGESMFIDGGDLFTHMLTTHPDQLPPLLAPDAVQVRRGDQVAGNPIFQLGGDDRLRVAFSNHEYNDAIPSPGSKHAFNSVDVYVKNPDNWHTITPRPGQLTIIDNTRMLHGRKAWGDSEGQTRRSIRAWYDNNPNGREGIETGIQLPAATVSRVRSLSR